MSIAQRESEVIGDNLSVRPGRVYPRGVVQAGQAWLRLRIGCEHANDGCRMGVEDKSVDKYEINSR